MAFWTLAAFLVLSFLTGGGARADIQSLIILRPAAVVFCGVACLTLTWRDIRAHAFLFAVAAAVIALVASQLVPLPPRIWQGLPGREILVAVDRAAGLGNVWRPISMVPSATWNALYSLFVPLAVLLLGVQLTREQRFKTLYVLLLLGLLSGFLGLMQAIGDPNGTLYFYKITNNGSAVGLFSNRNHQAVLLALMFPALAVYASVGAKTVEQIKLREWTAAAAGAVLIPLLLVTGSRAGLILGVIGLASAAILYRRQEVDVPRKRKVRTFDLRYGFAALCAVSLGGLTLLASRAEALQRLVSPDQMEDQRFKIWGPIAQMGWNYFPFGSGLGSFAEIYQIDEPSALLNPSYLNHAHNDFLEIFMTAGLPALALLLVVVLAYVRMLPAVYRADARQRRSQLYARLGAVMIGMMFLASLVDYPVRTPSLAGVLVLSALWLRSVRDQPSKTLAVPDRLG